MFWIVLILFAGFGVGYLIKGRVKLPTGIITMVSICLLLFALGLEIGSDKELISNLPTMGLTALSVAVLGILGSCIAVVAFSGLYQRLKSRDLARESAGREDGEK